MSLSTLQPRHVFGLRGDLKDSVHYLDEAAVAYPSGNNVVLYSLDTKTQKFLPGSAAASGITSVVPAPSSKYLAVAEVSDTKATVTVYDVQTLRKKKVLTSTTAACKEYVSIAFSPDERLLAAQGGGPDWNLVVWNWDKAKAVHVSPTPTLVASPVLRCSFSLGPGGGDGRPPEGATSVLSIIGSGTFRCLRGENRDTTWKTVPSTLAKRDAKGYSCHCWLSDGAQEWLAVGTAAGEVFIQEDGHLRMTLTLGSSGGSSGGGKVECIAGHSKGFAAGTDGGVVVLFERVLGETEAPFRQTKALPVHGNLATCVRGLAFAPAADTLLAALSSGQLLTLNMAMVENMKEEGENYEPLVAAFHGGEVVGGDVCVRRPLAATIATDRTLRLWNLAGRTLELREAFGVDLWAVAVHPGGLQLLLACADKLRLATLLITELRVIKEISIKAACACLFSRGGQYFAAANGNNVHVFHTYTCATLGILRGHTGRVTALSWAANDSHLLSAGADGAVYAWSIPDLKREREHVLKGCSYTCVEASPDGGTLYAAGSDLRLRVLQEVPSAGTQAVLELETPALITQLAVTSGGELLFAGTEDGAVRCYRLPLGGELVAAEWRWHSAAVTALRVTPDDATLVSCGQDSSVFLFSIRLNPSHSAVADKLGEAAPLAYAAEVLVDKAELDDRKQRTAELEADLAEERLQAGAAAALAEAAAQQRLQETTAQLRAETEATKTKLKAVAEERNDMEVEYEMRLKAAAELRTQELAAASARQQEALAAEAGKYAVLQQQKDTLMQRWQEQNAQLAEQHSEALRGTTAGYEARLAEQAAAVAALQAEKAKREEAFLSMQEALEAEVDDEVEQLNRRHKAELKAAKDATERAVQDKADVTKMHVGLEQEAQKLRQAAQQAADQKSQLQQTIAGLEAERASLQAAAQLHADILKEQQVAMEASDLRVQQREAASLVQQAELERLRAELQAAAAREAALQAKVKEKEAEVEERQRRNIELALQSEDTRMARNSAQQEAARQEKTAARSKAQLSQVLRELDLSRQHWMEPHQLKAALKAMYDKHLTLVAQPLLDAASPQAPSEDAKEAEALRKTLVMLQTRGEKDAEQHAAAQQRLNRENAQLVGMVRQLTAELAELKPGGAQQPAGVPLRRSSSKQRKASTDAAGSAAGSTVTAVYVSASQQTPVLELAADGDVEDILAERNVESVPLAVLSGNAERKQSLPGPAGHAAFTGSSRQPAGQAENTAPGGAAYGRSDEEEVLGPGGMPLTAKQRGWVEDWRQAQVDFKRMEEEHLAIVEKLSEDYERQEERDRRRMQG